MNLYCNNCGKNGHLFHQCKSPIISYGLIVFREPPSKQNAREYLLIRRRDTLGFVDFMRGKYSIYNKEYILNMIKQMTNDEKHRLIHNSFSQLWEDLWGCSNQSKIEKSQRNTFTLGSIPERDLSEAESVGIGRFSGEATSVSASRTQEELRSENDKGAVINPFETPTLQKTDLRHSSLLRPSSFRPQAELFRPSSFRPSLLRPQAELLRPQADKGGLINPFETPTLQKQDLHHSSLIRPQADKGALINPFETPTLQKTDLHHSSLLRPQAELQLLSKTNRPTDPYKAEEQNSRNKFESLKSGIYTKMDSYNLEELIQMTEPIWIEPEWGFPKGRRNYQERDYDCAVREFCEETGYSPNKLIPLKNIQPFEEIFTGSNYKSYKHKYYVTYMQYEDTLSSRFVQECEVSESAWMSVDKCDVAVRSYNIEKKRVLMSVDKMLSDNYLSKMCA